MARAWTPGGAADSGRFANLFVLFALVAMLVGTVLIIAAREPAFVDVPAGESVEVLHYEAPEWDPFGHPLKAVVTTNQPFNITVLELSGARDGEARDFHEENGTRVTWNTTAEPGEEWTTTVTNMGNQTIRVATTVSHNLVYTVGGILVGVGVLGFVSYRMGMRRSGP